MLWRVAVIDRVHDHAPPQMSLGWTRSQRRSMLLSRTTLHSASEPLHYICLPVTTCSDQPLIKSSKLTTSQCQIGHAALSH